MTVPRGWICVLAMVWGNMAGAQIYHADPGNYRLLLEGLQPGDRLELTAGEYTRGLPVHGLSGTPEAPIVITGPTQGEPAVLVGAPRFNTVSLVDAAYIEIRCLEIDGRGIGADAVKAEGHARWTHHITLEDLYIHGHDANIQRVGISTKSPAWDWVIRNNVIRNVGTGMYLGNSDGRAPFVRGLIEHNLVLDTLGYNLEIKHQQPRPDIPDMPTVRAATVIRHNVFAKTSGKTGHGLRRPNVLVGHWPLSGPGQDDYYAIYGNVFYENPGEALFQGEGNLALYANVFIQSTRNGFPAVAVQPHNDMPRDIAIFHNTVLARGAGIVVRGGARGHVQRVEANVIFAESALSGGEPRFNLTASYDQADDYVAQPRPPHGLPSLYPRAGRVEAQPFVPAGMRNVLDGDRDFNGQLYDAHYRGAYAGAGANPGWRIALQRKPMPR